MKKIGGNIQAEIQVNAPTKNAIGELVDGWATVQNINGFLDYSSGDSKYNTYQAKMEESTHVFLADYVELDNRISAESSRMKIKGKIYDVLLIDNPMELDYQWEFYLRYIGGQENGG